MLIENQYKRKLENFNNKLLMGNNIIKEQELKKHYVHTHEQPRLRTVHHTK